MTNPTRVDEAMGRRPGETIEEWVLRTFGPMPAPAANATPEPEPDPEPVMSPRLRRASALLERSIPRAYAWL